MTIHVIAKREMREKKAITSFFVFARLTQLQQKTKLRQENHHITR